MNFGTPELLIVLVIILLVFGGTQLPKLARSLGRAQKEFKDGLTSETSAEPDDDVAADNKKNQAT
jgi:sec-independent protein translocase protein TatA